MRSSLRQLFRNRFAGVFGLVLLVLAESATIRIFLLAKSWSAVNHAPLSLLALLAKGTFNDLVVAAVIAIPAIIYFAVIPNRWLANRWHRVLLLVAIGLFTYIFTFGALAEWFFWDEFGVRFNFIAVDYLIYTTEVIDNIRESYPLGILLPSLLLAPLVTILLVWRTGWLASWSSEMTSYRRSLSTGAIALVIASVVVLIGRNQWDVSSPNAYNQELAHNGLHAFVDAYADNELDYERFYPTEQKELAGHTIRELIKQDNSTYLTESPTDINRHIKPQGKEIRPNVVLITVESLSAKYLHVFNDELDVTPHLDELSKQSLFFTNCFATGTRTVRGMEAITLSVPPTPGRSIVKRPDNDNLFSLRGVFASRGYDAMFLYGGYGYFDNMNNFFSENGCRIVDLAAVEDSDVTFSNAWGACDEDSLRWALNEADAAAKSDKPFFQFVMTTSNHRPYTYPAGRFDDQMGHRVGAIQYTDYAIGDYLKKASEKPWFDNTIFVVVADHCASSAGREALNIAKYHIPLFIYAPKLLDAKQIDQPCSQIDIAPTLLGLLNWEYDSRFFGRDVFQPTSHSPHILLGTYQKLALLQDNKLCLLQPAKDPACFSFEAPEYELNSVPGIPSLMTAAIAYYQMASYQFHRAQKLMADAK